MTNVRCVTIPLNVYCPFTKTTANKEITIAMQNYKTTNRYKNPLLIAHAQGLKARLSKLVTNFFKFFLIHQVAQGKTVTDYSIPIV